MRRGGKRERERPYTIFHPRFSDTVPLPRVRPRNIFFLIESDPATTSLIVPTSLILFTGLLRLFALNDRVKLSLIAGRTDDRFEDE